MLAHGLFSPINKSGLWVHQPYGGINFLGQRLTLGKWREIRFREPQCTASARFQLRNSSLWQRQGRLIDQRTSQAILKHLDINKGGCQTVEPDLDALRTSGFIAAKCGIFQDVWHVPLYYKDASSPREFVVSILTRDNNRSVVKNLFRDLIALVP